MQLLVAMHECVAWIIGNEVDRDGIKRHNVHNVLKQATHLGLTNSSDLKGMPVQMHRMLISAAIAKYQSIAIALLDLQGFVLWPRFVVNRPEIELRTIQRTYIAKGQYEGFVRLLCLLRTTKRRVVPLIWAWLLPDW